jgi:hypothetical protein
MATVNLGRVGFVNKGTYNGATAYKVNDVVTYNAGTYACIQANTGQAPTNTSYWQNWVEDNAVHKTGDETIAGIKTFTSSPIVPTPTTDMQVATKKYVDENFGGTVLTTGDQTISGIKTFTSSPIAPTPTAGDNSTRIATTAFVQANAGTTWVANDLRAKTALNATGTAPIYACRAWVNFNGTGTVAIRASGNVSSITDNGTGDYTVNFTTAMPDANYGVTDGTTRGIAQSIGSGYSSRINNIYSALTTSFRVQTLDYTGNSNTMTAIDQPLIQLSIFR